MNNIFKNEDLKKNGFSIKYLGIILSSIFIIAASYYKDIYIEKYHVISIAFLLIIISTCLGGIISGTLSLITLFFYIMSVYKFTSAFAVESYIISNLVIIAIISHFNTMSRKRYKNYFTNNDMYNFILDFIAEGILVRQRDKIVYANKSFRKYFKKENDDTFVGSSILNYISKKNRIEIEKYFNDLEYSNQIESNMRFEYLNDDNSTSLFKLENKKISLEDEDMDLSIINITTEEVNRLEFIRESKKRYKQILSILPLGVLIHVDDRIIFANNEITKMLNYGNYKFLLGEDIKKFLKHKNKSIFYDNLSTLKKENKVEPIEIDVIDINGSILSVEIINSIIPFEKQAILTIIKDITEEKRKEEDKLILAETITYEKIKAEFFANVSHDLKTPINVIYSSLQIMDSLVKTNKVKDKDNKLATYIDIMKQNCYRELKLANNLIDLSRYEMNGFELNLKQVNIVSLVENITMEVAKFATKKDINLIFDTESEEIICYVDEVKIERIMLNLLSNSIKFTKPGGEIMVFITTKKDFVIITVKDNGIGIPHDKINYIFDRFKQVDKSFARKNEGSGLGLSVVKAIVNLHGGNIKVESEYKLGTEFSIFLSYKRYDEQITMGIDNLFKDYGEMINIEFSDIYL